MAQEQTTGQGTRRRRGRAAATPNGGAAAAAKPDERADSERMILKRERMIALPDGLTDESVEELRALVEQNLGTTGAVKTVDAWVPVAIGRGDKLKAIESYAGKPGSPDAIPGTYKAPPVRSMAGGAVYERPPEPKVERKVLDD